MIALIVPTMFAASGYSLIYLLGGGGLFGAFVIFVVAKMLGRRLSPKKPVKLTDMKHNHNHDNVRNAGPELVSVRFEFIHPTATTVCVAGTFNQWQPEAKTLHPAGGGRWLKETALAPGSYEYCLVVDGQWMPV